jgi:glutathione S-transferase
VPVLDVGEFKIWDSLAICEYLAEQNPDLALWPKLDYLRAQARSIGGERHSSFMALRQLCPMNIQAQYSIAEGQALWAQHAELRADVERIEQIWAQRADEHPFLFGDFSIADAFYAPVVMRFKSYALPVSERSQQYMQHIMQHPAVIQWVDAARAEAA